MTGKVVLNKKSVWVSVYPHFIWIKDLPETEKKNPSLLLPSLSIWRGSNNPYNVHLMQLGIWRKAFIHIGRRPSDRPVRNRLSPSLHIWNTHTVSQSSHLERARMGREMSLVRKVICFLRGIKDHNWIFFKTAQSFLESQTAIILIIVSWPTLKGSLRKKKSLPSLQVAAYNFKSRQLCNHEKIPCCRRSNGFTVCTFIGV